MAVALIALPLLGGPAQAASGKVDISKTSEGKAKIHTAASSFTAQGDPTSDADLVAAQYPDGAVVVSRKGIAVTDETASGGGYRIETPAEATPTSGQADSGMSAQAAAAAPYWSAPSTHCYGSLFRGAAHMDTCYRIYSMVNDGSSTWDYKRLDFYASMFAEGRVLSWGWISAVQQAGPVLYWVDWAPDVDVAQNCGSFGLSISILGVGGGFSKTFCELNNITKAGSSQGYFVSFKDYWDWTGSLPQKDRDRSVAMELGHKYRQGLGSVSYGLSWNFAASDTITP